MIAIMLLAIYVCLVAYGIFVVECMGDETCKNLTAEDFTDRMASSLALIGGLVSALVIAELSITKSGEAPAARLLSPEIALKRKVLMQIITGLYLIFWFIAGLAAFIWGYLIVDPGNELPALSDLGQAWLGVAVGAGYAYFGIKNP